ncbi:hypothetical protein ABBQ38_005878 [Trebouxia sp. C0009 RCD-2024]
MDTRVLQRIYQHDSIPSHSLGVTQTRHGMAKHSTAWHSQAQQLSYCRLLSATLSSKCMMCNTSEGRMAAQRRTRNLPTAYMSDVHLPSLPRLKNKPQLLQYPGHMSPMSVKRSLD